jgi:hypothetical protein
VQPRGERRGVADGGTEQCQERGLEGVLRVGFAEQIAAHAPHQRAVPGDEFGERGVVAEPAEQLGVGPRVACGSPEE